MCTSSLSRVQLCRRCMCKNTSGVESQINTLIYSSEVFSSQLRLFRQDDHVNSQRTRFSHIKTNNGLIQNYVTLYSCTVSSAYLCCVAKWFLSAKREFCVVVTILDFRIGFFLQSFLNVSNRKLLPYPKIQFQAQIEKILALL